MANDQRLLIDEEMTNDFSIIGKPTAMVDAAGKTTGAGKYADDLSLPGMLIGRILTRTPASKASTPAAPRNWKAWSR